MAKSKRSTKKAGRKIKYIMGATKKVDQKMLIPSMNAFLKNAKKSKCVWKLKFKGAVTAEQFELILKQLPLVIGKPKGKTGGMIALPRVTDIQAYTTSLMKFLNEHKDQLPIQIHIVQSKLYGIVIVEISNNIRYLNRSPSGMTKKKYDYLVRTSQYLLLMISILQLAYVNLVKQATNIHERMMKNRKITQGLLTLWENKECIDEYETIIVNNYNHVKEILTSFKIANLVIPEAGVMLDQLFASKKRFNNIIRKYSSDYHALMRRVKASAEKYKSLLEQKRTSLKKIIDDCKSMRLGKLSLSNIQNLKNRTLAMHSILKYAITFLKSEIYGSAPEIILQYERSHQEILVTHQGILDSKREDKDSKIKHEHISKRKHKQKIESKAENLKSSVKQTIAWDAVIASLRALPTHNSFVPDSKGNVSLARCLTQMVVAAIKMKGEEFIIKCENIISRVSHYITTKMCRFEYDSKLIYMLRLLGKLIQRTQSIQSTSEEMIDKFLLYKAQFYIYLLNRDVEKNIPISKPIIVKSREELMHEFHQITLRLQNRSSNIKYMSEFLTILRKEFQLVTAKKIEDTESSPKISSTVTPVDGKDFDLKTVVQNPSGALKHKVCYKPNYSIYELMAISKKMTKIEISQKIKCYQQLLPVLASQNNKVFDTIAASLKEILMILRTFVSETGIDEKPQASKLNNALLIQLIQNLISGKTYAEKDLVNSVMQCLKLDETVLGDERYACYDHLKTMSKEVVENYNADQKDESQKLVSSDLRLVLYGGSLDALYKFDQKNADLDFRFILSSDSVSRLGSDNITTLGKLLSQGIKKITKNFKLFHAGTKFYAHNLLYGKCDIPIDITCYVSMFHNIPIFTKDINYDNKFEFCDKSLTAADIIGQMHLRQLHLTTSFLKIYSIANITHRCSVDAEKNYDYETVSILAYMLKSCAKYFGRYGMRPARNLQNYLIELSENESLLRAVLKKFIRSYCFKKDGHETEIQIFFSQYLLSKYMNSETVSSVFHDCVCEYSDRHKKKYRSLRYVVAH